jgi:phosphopantetheine adenylyltransferase
MLYSRIGEANIISVFELSKLLISKNESRRSLLDLEERIPIHQLSIESFPKMSASYIEGFTSSGMAES